MILLHDRASMARALTLDLDPKLLVLLRRRIASLSEGEFDLTDQTEILIVQPGDTEADIVRQVGFSPLEEPIEGAVYPDPAFHPHWDWLVDHGGIYELCESFGSTFSYLLLIPDQQGVLSTLRTMCAEFATPSPKVNT